MPSIPTPLTIFAACSIGLTLSAPDALAAQHLSNGLVITQSSRMLGTVTTRIVKDAILIETSTQMRFLLRYQANDPNPEIIAYSLRAKKICRQKTSRFVNPFTRSWTMFSNFSIEDATFRPPLPIANPWPLAAKEAKGFYTLRVAEIKSSEDYTKHQPARRLKVDIDGGQPSEIVCQSLVMPAYSSAMLEPIRVLYGLPRKLDSGIPLDLRYTCVSGKKNYLLKMQSIKAASLQSSLFEPPTDLKPIGNIQQLLDAGDSDDSMKMIMGI